MNVRSKTIFRTAALSLMASLILVLITACGKESSGTLKKVDSAPVVKQLPAAESNVSSPIIAPIDKDTDPDSIAVLVNPDNGLPDGYKPMILSTRMFPSSSRRRSRSG